MVTPANALPCYGNQNTMNLNTLILTNIQASPYFKVELFEKKTYHEVIDEIFYKVDHLEPWEKGSRKTGGQTGMCGGVRGVGAGGIVSSAYCLLFKLFTLKLTRKQVQGLINHRDSPYIRGLGFMFIRYTQPPADLWDWFDDYLEDDEEIDVKAGGGNPITIGEMVITFLTKLEWYASLFPRIPVPVEKDIHQKMKQRFGDRWAGGQLRPRFQKQVAPVVQEEPEPRPNQERGSPDYGEAERRHRGGERRRSRSRERRRSSSRERKYNSNRHRESSYDRDLRRERDRHHKARSYRHSSRDRSRERRRSRDRSRERRRSRDRSSRERRRSRERSSDRGHRHSHGDKRYRSRSKER